MYFEMSHQKKIVTEIIQWMNNNPHMTLSINNVANRAGYSRRHIQRMFKTCTGITLGRYIKYLHLSRAAIELINGEQTVLDIALQHGYESQQALTRAMKCRTGVNPGAIRRMSSSDKMDFICKINNIFPLSISSMSLSIQ